MFADVVEAAGYGQIIPPLLEDLGVFQRVGEATDVVTKEMYDFVDKGGRHIALRPELTASVCRAFVEHRPPTPWKVWYAGPNFRYEKPQRGRYRQFDQVGIEVLGADDPYLDVEVIALGWEFYRRPRPAPGRRCCSTRSASPTTGPATSRRCATYFERRPSTRSPPQSRATLDTQPAARARLQARAGRGRHRRRADDRRLPQRRRRPPTSTRCTAGLDAPRHPVHASTRKLVRGLDYYRRTTFEFQGGTLDSAQNALGGGGRYDGLVEALGGPPTPGIGFALGVDRTLLACDDEGVFAAADRRARRVRRRHHRRPARRLRVTAELRAAGLAADRGVRRTAA